MFRVRLRSTVTITIEACYCNSSFTLFTSDEEICITDVIQQTTKSGFPHSNFSIN